MVSDSLRKSIQAEIFGPRIRFTFDAYEKFMNICFIKCQSYAKMQTC